MAHKPMCHFGQSYPARVSQFSAGNGENEQTPVSRLGSAVRLTDFSRMVPEMECGGQL